MTRNPVTVAEDASITEAARLMLQHKISGLPLGRLNSLSC
jgi:CBS domain-containing protein